MRAKTELQAAGYDGRFYRPTGTIVHGPIEDQIVCRVSGYVADNHAWYETPKAVRWASSRRSSAGEFLQMTVADAKGRLWPFLLRQSVGREIEDYELVAVEGIWIKRGRHWRLLATKVVATRSQKEAVAEELKIPARLACSYCGKEIAETELWGFDEAWHVECSTCGGARGRMNRSDFLKLCNEIAGRRKGTDGLDGGGDGGTTDVRHG